MSDPSPGEPPKYNVYRSRKRLRDRFSPSGGANPLEAIRRRRGRGDKGPQAPGQRTKPTGITPRRVVKWIALAIVGWTLAAIVAFFISAQVNGGVDDKTSAALSGGGAVLTGSNVLVLGSQERPKSGRVRKGQGKQGAGGELRAPTFRQHHRHTRRLRLGAQDLDPARHAREHPRPRRHED